MALLLTQYLSQKLPRRKIIDSQAKCEYTFCLS